MILGVSPLGVAPLGASSATPAPIVYTAFKPALLAYLRSAPALAALLAADADGVPCVGPAHTPESDGYPAIAWRVVGRTPGLDFDDDAGFAEADVELTARALDPDDSDALATALVALFHNKGNYALSGVRVMVSLVDLDSDDYDAADDGSDDGVYSDTVSVFFRYRTR